MSVDIRPENARQFYDERFREDYMAEWPTAKTERVAALVRGLPLPARGKALDFGCGQGVFTGVLRAALPGWQIVGSDLSEVGLQKARARLPECRFLGPDEVANEGPFDFVFTHHVLEHVTSLAATFSEMSAPLSGRASMLHIMPCGNPGSFEQRVCLWRRNGIQRELGNRFFFEEEGHLRRLTADDLTAALAPFGFEMKSAWFANHFWGALDWITDLDRSFVWSLTNPAAGRGASGRLALTWWMSVLTTMQIAKHPPKVGGNPLSRMVRRFFHSRAQSEWAARQRDPRGSEMYLYFERRRE